MSLRSDGIYRCDRCGADVDNGSITAAAVVSDLDPDTGGIRLLHFCRPRCVQAVLSADNLADYSKTKGS